MAIQDWQDRMGEARWRERSGAFGSAAALYDRVRPPYPPEAIAWALDPLGPGSWRVVDIGAGTGIMTRGLAALGHDVTAVEPDELMRERLVAATPGVTAVLGSAEHLPFADCSYDAAVAAQAYHWFDRDQAHPELARVIRPGGVFAAVWNMRDESVPWVGAYSELVEGDRGPQESGMDRWRDYGELFTPVELRVFHHSTTHTPDSVIALMQSRSYYLTATPERQRAMTTAVGDLVANHPDTAGRAEFELPYVTQVFRAVRH